MEYAWWLRLEDGAGAHTEQVMARFWGDGGLLASHIIPGAESAGMMPFNTLFLTGLCLFLALARHGTIGVGWCVGCTEYRSRQQQQQLATTVILITRVAVELLWILGLAF